jgi:hypothetical protein
VNNSVLSAGNGCDVAVAGSSAYQSYDDRMLNTRDAAINLEVNSSARIFLSRFYPDPKLFAAVCAEYGELFEAFTPGSAEEAGVSYTDPATVDATFEEENETTQVDNTPWATRIPPATPLGQTPRSYFSLTERFSAPSYAIHAPPDPTSHFQATGLFTLSALLPVSANFTGSAEFAVTEPITASGALADSPEFAGSVRFGGSAFFEPTGDFTHSDVMTNSVSFGDSDPLTASAPIAASQPLKPSGVLSSSRKFSSSGPFSHTQAFTGTEAFNDTVDFDDSDAWPKSVVFAPSSRLPRTQIFSGSGTFTPPPSGSIHATETSVSASPVGTLAVTETPLASQSPGVEAVSLSFVEASTITVSEIAIYESEEIIESQVVHFTTQTYMSDSLGIFNMTSVAYWTTIVVRVSYSQIQITYMYFTQSFIVINQILQSTPPPASSNSLIIGVATGAAALVAIIAALAVYIVRKGNEDSGQSHSVDEFATKGFTTTDTDEFDTTGIVVDAPPPEESDQEIDISVLKAQSGDGLDDLEATGQEEIWI